MPGPSCLRPPRTANSQAKHVFHKRSQRRRDEAQGSSSVCPRFRGKLTNAEDSWRPRSDTRKKSTATVSWALLDGTSILAI